MNMSSSAVNVASQLFIERMFIVAQRKRSLPGLAEVKALTVSEAVQCGHEFYGHLYEVE